eukprot:CAMPEP_0185253140 /NCGR_PEP_ID=MMETSP1359-20130426/2015_1 /TAXON_ID=552665 /ORGANISM="Bigelowiella longifila, Strain CCMP242" /LENGTH=67 /DNA_ID=CAMNT_0027835473 /DNA_START=500 /DNA_END=703 /DNA_ORIENTATION=-
MTKMFAKYEMQCLELNLARANLTNLEHDMKAVLRQIQPGPAASPFPFHLQQEAFDNSVNAHVFQLGS